MKKMFMVRMLIILFLACLLPGNSFGKGNVVAVVNGVEITESQVKAALARKISSTSFHRNIPDEKLEKLKKEVVEDLIEGELMYQDALGKVKVSNEEVADGFRTIEDRFPGKAELRDAIKKAGTTEERIKDEIRRDLYIKKVSDLEVEKKAVVTEKEAREYFNGNREKFKDPGRMKLREIFFSVPADATAEEREEKRKKAEDILKKVRSGEDFGILAWNNSEDKFRYKSGEIGYVHTDTLLPETRKALEKVHAGEATEIVETIYGYYIFYLEERVEPAQLEFKDVKDKLIKDLKKKKHDELKKSYIDRLRKNATIKK